jgi:hypothetical protein
MRSRYTAHAKKEFDYIFETTLPSNRQDADRKGTAAWSRKLDWQRLEVRHSENGGPDDSVGTVEFLARYRKDGKAFDHHEIAEFVGKTAAGISRTARRRSRCRPSVRGRKSAETTHAPAAAVRSIRNAAGLER